MKLFKNITAMIKGSFKFLKNYFNSKMLRRTMYSFHYEHSRLKETSILYEAFYGRGMLCGPYALFIEALETPELKGYKHIWVIDDKKELKRVKGLYKGFDNVSFVKFGSFKYVKALATVKYLINNSTFIDMYTKREGQVYINTWHGIPLKTLGYDMPDGAIESANIQRNFLVTDYLVSASPFMTDMYKKSYRLDGMFEGKIIEEGYPRLDLLIKNKREDVLSRLEKAGVSIDRNKKIILYAPTWRGQSFFNDPTDRDSYYSFKEKLEKLIDTNEYQVLIKAHQKVYQLSKKKMQAPFFIPAIFDANEILSVTDILVSDFSSIFYDYLALERPVIFYITDIEEYKEVRGTYHGLEHLPGPVEVSLYGVAADISTIGAVWKKYKTKYDEVRDYACAYTEGNISKKIIDIAFLGKEEGYNIKTCDRSKKRIFISRGPMRGNGISTAIINILDEIDYDRYDITMMIKKTPADNSDKNYRKINPKVRLVYRNSTFNMTFFENISHRFISRFTTKRPRREFYKREWIRSYGGMKFDYMLDFDGYNYFFILLMLQNEGVEKAIWLHNDMLEERKLKYEWLENVFRSYSMFDRVVACGEEIMKVNAEKLGGTYIRPEQLTYVDNPINYRRVLEMAGNEGDIVTDEEGNRCYVTKDEYVTYRKRKKGKRRKVTVGTQYAPFTPEYDEKGVKNMRFVSIGRLSPEKNQAVLIRAFKRFHDEHENSYLYILGYGPLKKELTDLVEELGLTGSVFIPGFVKNPYIIMKNSECFILPSVHEGQPVVVHEARILGLSIVMSDFSSVKGVEIPNGQLIVGHDEDAILSGLNAFAAGKVPADYRFDYHEFNQKAVEQFYDVIEGREARYIK